MKIAFLNLCHDEPNIVEKVASKLTEDSDFHMFIHVDLKSDITRFNKNLKSNERVTFIENRKKVFWGGFNAVEATMELLKAALNSTEKFDYFVLLQNYDYPIRSNVDIKLFFKEHQGKEFIRGCNIAHSTEWFYYRKYKFRYHNDQESKGKTKGKRNKFLKYMQILFSSIKTLPSNGVIKDGSEKFDLYYGAAQWAISRKCAEYIIEFEKTHQKFNERMKLVQFPDEEYFHTIVHNSKFKYNCIKYDEPREKWLVNWRNLHYFEYPKEVTVFTQKDFDKIMAQNCLFIRKVKSGISDDLIRKIDEATKGNQIKKATRYKRVTVE